MADTRVDRGYVSTWDFDKDDFTTDGTWRWLDISSLVPSGAKRVDILVIIKGDAVGKALEFSEFAQAGFNVDYVRTQEVNQYNQESMTINLPSNDSRIIAYYGHDFSFDAIYVIVKGWWT